MDKKRIDELERISREARKHIIKMIARVGIGHVGGSLSIVELLAVLYYHVMNVDAQNPQMEGRDRLVLSKGHGGPALYAILAEKGFFPIEWLDTLNQPGTMLPSHVDMLKTPGVDMTAGSLGQGISCGVGIALASKLKNDGAYTFVILGDGESQEGIVWEATMAAAHYKLNRLIVFLDNNEMQIDGMVNEVSAMFDPEEKWRAFGFDTFRADGHDISAIADAIDLAKSRQSEKPAMIVLDTVKGKGISFAEEAGTASHSMVLTEEVAKLAVEELERGRV